MKTAVRGTHKLLKILNSGFRRNDRKPQFKNFYEVITLYYHSKFLKNEHVFNKFPIFYYFMIILEKILLGCILDRLVKFVVYEPQRNSLRYE